MIDSIRWECVTARAGSSLTTFILFALYFADMLRHTIGDFRFNLSGCLQNVGQLGDREQGMQAHVVAAEMGFTILLTIHDGNDVFDDDAWQLKKRIE